MAVCAGVILESEGGEMRPAKCTRESESQLLVEWDSETMGGRSARLAHASTVVMSECKVDVWSSSARCDAIFPYRTPRWLGSTLFRGCVALTAHDGCELGIEVLERHYSDGDPPLSTAPPARVDLLWSRDDAPQLGQGRRGASSSSRPHNADVSTASSRSADSSAGVDEEDEFAGMASDVEGDVLYDDVGNRSASESETELGDELGDEDEMEDDDTNGPMRGV